jgi:hypothetical protein
MFYLPNGVAGSDSNPDAAQNKAIEYATSSASWAEM